MLCCGLSVLEVGLASDLWVEVLWCLFAVFDVAAWVLLCWIALILWMFLLCLVLTDCYVLVA